MGSYDKRDFSSFDAYQSPAQADAYGSSGFAAFAQESERTTFIRRTYLHLAGAIAAFVAIETIIFAMVPPETLQGVMQTFFGFKFAWIALMIGFVGIGWLAQSWASSDTSPQMQYLGLGLYVVAQAIIFVPMLYLAMLQDPQGGLLQSAGLLTLIVFGGLTAMVFVTGSDFSWVGRILFWAGIVACGAVLCGVMFGFGLGLWFSVAMIGLASAYIMYDTSNVLHHYRTTQHVAAALALFASVALLFWYILRLLMSLQRN